MKVQFFLVPQAQSKEAQEEEINDFLKNVEVKYIFQNAAPVSDPRNPLEEDNPHYRVVGALITIFYEEK